MEVLPGLRCRFAIDARGIDLEWRAEEELLRSNERGNEMEADAKARCFLETINVFVSYAHEDHRWVDPNDKHNLIPFLAASLRRLNVKFWLDKELAPGEKYKLFIRDQIDRSQVALLIVSQDFLNSEFIESDELPRITEREHQGLMTIVPILVKPCEWSDFPVIEEHQMLPGSIPLIKFVENDAAWAEAQQDVLHGLKAQVMRIRAKSMPKQPDNAMPDSLDVASPDKSGFEQELLGQLEKEGDMFDKKDEARPHSRSDPPNQGADTPSMDAIREELIHQLNATSEHNVNPAS